jgi:zinc finger SWIM domain-containing protein 3
MDVKQLPDHYVLKRWTREACHGIVQDNDGRKVSEDPKLDATCRYKFLSHRFISLASHAAKSKETFELVNNVLYQLQLQVDEFFFKDAPIINSTNNDQTS